MLDKSLFNDTTKLSGYRNSVWRVIESQEEVATLNIVDDIEEQDVLESLIDEVKPPYRKGTDGMHYLLKTAFRYPPLKWGSRFGTTLMPSYFYASETAATALAECAYYRFLFLDDMKEPYLESIRSEYCLFSALVASENCLDLTSSTYTALASQIKNPINYGYSQAIGHWAFERGNIEIIRFSSARQEGGVNIAVANPNAMRSKKPSNQERWLCLTKPESVSFSSRGSEISYLFPREKFCNKKGNLLRVF